MVCVLLHRGGHFPGHRHTVAEALPFRARAGGPASRPGRETANHVPSAFGFSAGGGGLSLLEGESRGGELAARSRLLDDLRLDFLICSVP